MLSIFLSPARYTQGKNATTFLGPEMATLGMEGPALIVSGRSARSLLSEVWCASLGEAGIPYHVHAFGGECSASEINRINGLSGRRTRGSSSGPAEARCWMP